MRIKVIEWPSKSPHLSPRENPVWERKLQVAKYQFLYSGLSQNPVGDVGKPGGDLQETPYSCDYQQGFSIKFKVKFFSGIKYLFHSRTCKLIYVMCFCFVCFFCFFGFTCKLFVQLTCLRTFGKRTFEAMVPELRNTLIVHLRFTDPVKSFKSQLKTYLFTQACQ